MKAVGVHHVALAVADVDAAVDFYTRVLGLTVRTDRPDFGIAGAWLDAGSQQVHLFEGPQPTARGQHFAVVVDDLDAMVADAQAAGLEVKAPGESVLGRVTFVNDPSGNVVEVREATGVFAGS